MRERGMENEVVKKKKREVVSELKSERSDSTEGTSLYFFSLRWSEEKKLVKICVEDTNEITCERTTIGKGRVDSPISCPVLSSEIFQINDKFMIAAFMENI